MAELLDKDKIETFLQETKPVESALGMRLESDKAMAKLAHRIQTEGADLRIAVVDDDFIVQEIVKNTFAAPGSTIFTFDAGDEFLDDIPPDLDLVFLDLMMPRVDGFGVMETLKAIGSSTPIIVLSAVSRRDTVLKALGYGIRSYMTKPLKPEDLLKKTFEVVGTHF